jgi:hypothetical protein
MKMKEMKTQIEMTDLSPSRCDVLPGSAVLAASVGLASMALTEQVQASTKASGTHEGTRMTTSNTIRTKDDTQSYYKD